MNRRAFLGSVAVPLAGQARKRPNFVFLIADDHAAYVMGCDGSSKAETPNLDRLAASGTRFAAHYCNSPVCTPSRQSFFTGQLPHAAGVTVLRTALDAAKPTIAKQLKAAGYSTAVFGKMHFNRPGESGLHGFDTMMTEPELNRTWNAETPTPVSANIRTKKLPWRPFVDPARVWLNADNLPYPRKPEEMRAACQLRHVDAYLQDHKEKPFALWVSFLEPHSPFDFPVGANHFESRSFDLPRVGAEDGPQIPLVFRDLPDEDKRGINAAYYNSARYLDSNIGAVLAMLKRYRLDENTFIVYMADHGYCLGHHGRFEKHCGYDQALRVPLIMSCPGRIRSGAVVRDLTESVDVPHTIVDVLDAPPLWVQHGHSLKPYLEGKRPSSPRQYVFSEYLENEEAYIRTAQFKYVYCSGHANEPRVTRRKTQSPVGITAYSTCRRIPVNSRTSRSLHPRSRLSYSGLMLDRFRSTHPEAAREPQRLSAEEALDWYVRPRDAVQ